MEARHRQRLLADFRRVLEHKTIHVLDIADDYRYMDPDLIEQLRLSVGACLALEAP